MSFQIKLQCNNSPLNQINKSLSSVSTITGTLRNETEVVDPVILIESNDLPYFNYLTIDALHRSYFVRDIKSIRNNIYEIYAHSDPLMSFKSEILRNRALVCRNENKFDLYLNDGVFKAKQNSRIGYLAFPGGFENFNYILLAAGGATQDS